jgi:hypothetical protein
MNDFVTLYSLFLFADMHQQCGRSQSAMWLKPIGKLADRLRQIKRTNGNFEMEL